MVNKPDMPRISWEEGFGPQDEARVSDEIVAALTRGLPGKQPGRGRLHFIVPTPAPYDSAEAAFLAAAADEGATPREFRVIALPRNGKCYAFGTDSLFKALLSHAFSMGPPELTFIAADCGFDLHASQDAIAEFVLAILQDRSTVPAEDFTGLHFDSGDLVEAF